MQGHQEFQENQDHQEQDYLARRVARVLQDPLAQLVHQGKQVLKELQDLQDLRARLGRAMEQWTDCCPRNHWGTGT